MTYWIAGYLAGMLATAALTAWSSPDRYEPRQWCAISPLILFWPLWLTVLTCGAFAFLCLRLDPDPK